MFEKEVRTELLRDAVCKRRVPPVIGLSQEAELQPGVTDELGPVTGTAVQRTHANACSISMRKSSEGEKLNF